MVGRMDGITYTFSFAVHFISVMACLIFKITKTMEDNEKIISYKYLKDSDTIERKC